MSRPPGELNSAFSLAGRVAVVTGSTAGIGKEIAIELAAAGAHTVVTGRNSEAGARVVDEICAMGHSASFIAVDVANETSVNDLFSSVATGFGPVDVLVNNAGQAQISHFLETTGAELLAICKVNLQGPFMCAREAIKQMRQADKRGSVINITSIGALRPAMFDVNGYCAAKGGVESITRTLAFEFAAFGIRVNAIAPGFIQTDMVSTAASGPIHPRGPILQPERLLMGRRGKPKDIATVALFLAGDASSYMTGQTLVVDGGFSLG